MIKYSDFINEIRKSVKDVARTSPTNSWDGDNATLLFVTKYQPLIANSYTIKIDGSAQVEDTDYTIDQDNGEILFTSAPASGADNVTADYKYAKFRDEDYFEMIENAFTRCYRKFWKEIDDSTTWTTVASQYDYAGPNNTLFLVSGHYRQVSSEPWTEIGSYSNLTYWKSLIK